MTEFAESISDRPLTPAARTAVGQVGLGIEIADVEAPDMGRRLRSTSPRLSAWCNDA